MEKMDKLICILYFIFDVTAVKSFIYLLIFI